jgi:hypothetical protein
MTARGDDGLTETAPGRDGSWQRRLLARAERSKVTEEEARIQIQIQVQVMRFRYIRTYVATYNWRAQCLVLSIEIFDMAIHHSSQGQHQARSEIAIIPI